MDWLWYCKADLPGFAAVVLVGDAIEAVGGENAMVARKRGLQGMLDAGGVQVRAEFRLSISMDFHRGRQSGSVLKWQLFGRLI
ncbi:hypothetical protein C1Y31_17435 [Pseudomonas sp. FW305-25]|nr:hypothetical protein C1Y31_17435 [Pseudomonas sp. FW305-25]PMY68317.1 hypothetical protein C1Y32_18435 [Pseudomonas sp. FW126-L8]PNA75384.1 hypothetical protein C1Y33_22800 [Pseudomonas sp. FW305-76]